MSVHSARGPEWERMKLFIWQRDNYTCQYCGVHLDESNRSVDHITPVSKGGSSTDPTNLWACCMKDNRAKGANGLNRSPFYDPDWMDSF